MVGRPRFDADVVGPGVAETGLVPLGDRPAGVARSRSSGPAVGPGSGMQDADDDAGHPASLVPRLEATDRCGGSGRISDWGRTSAMPRRRWPRVRALAALPGVRLRGVSRLYVTAPGASTDQPEFRNAVVALDVPVRPRSGDRRVALLVALKSLERAFGRRERERWGPREIDLDLLVFGRARISVHRPAARPLARPGEGALPLTVPHAEAAHRLFVLAPLADLAPRLVPPGWHETVETAAAARRPPKARRGPAPSAAGMARLDAGR